MCSTYGDPFYCVVVFTSVTKGMNVVLIEKQLLAFKDIVSCSVKVDA